MKGGMVKEEVGQREKVKRRREEEGETEEGKES